MTGGLQSAADMLASYGRGSDTMLAHVSPDEARFIDAVQGGRRTNPSTGLPEYSTFGKILKAVARVGATVGAFVLSGGNPAAAAAANAAVTKLTGGSWKQSLTSGALTFATAGIGNAASGASMWSNEALKNAGATAAQSGAQQGLSEATKQGIAQASAENAGFSAAVNAGVPIAEAATPSTMNMFASEAGNQFGQAAARQGIAAAAPTALSAAAQPAAPAIASTADEAILQAGNQGAQQTGLQSALAGVGGKTGVMLGLGAAMSPINADEPYLPGTSGPPAGFGGNSQIKKANPFRRVYQPYTGDYAKFGAPVSQGGSGGWNFYDEVNPAPTYMAEGGKATMGSNERHDTLASFRELIDKKQAELSNVIMPAKRHQLSQEINDLLSAKEAYTRQRFHSGADNADYEGKTSEYALGGRVRQYALGGGVLPPRSLGSGLGGLGSLRPPGIPSQIQSPQMGSQIADRMQARNMSPAAQRDEIRRAAAWGWQNAKNGGPIHGPGTGESDSIPAMLSDGEHVVDKKTVDIMGGGSNARGQRAMERMKMRARAQAGMRNPKKPPAFGGA